MKNFVSRIYEELRKENGLLHVSFGNIGSAILGATLWFFLARVVNVEAYGIVNFLMAISTVGAAASLLGLNTVLTIHASKNSTLKQQIFSLAFLISLVVSVICYAITGKLSVAIFVIGEVAFVMTTAEYLGMRKFKKYSYVVITQKALQFLMVVVLFYILNTDGIILGYAISAAVFGYPLFMNISRLSFSFNELKLKLKLSLHGYSMEMARIISTYSDKILIAPLFGFTMLGNYQIGAQFLMFLGIIPLILYNYLLPQLANGAKNRFIENLAVIIAILFSLGLVFAMPAVIVILFPNYHESILVTQIMVLGVIPWSITSIINSRFLACEKSKDVLFASLIFISSQYVLIVLLGNAYGLIGLGIATLFALCIETAFLLAAYNHHGRRKLTIQND